MQSISISQWIIIAILVVLLVGAGALFMRAAQNRNPGQHRQVNEPRENRNRAAPASGPSGFGGWFILVAIGVIAQPAVMIYKLVNSGDFDLSSAGETYTLQMIDIALYAVVILLQLSTTFLMIFRKRQFRPFYILTAIAVILFWPSEFLLITTQISAMTPEPFGRALQTMLNDRSTPGDATQWASTSIGVIILLLYVIRSHRVTNTFVR